MMRTLLIALALTILVGCGFQLRGSVSLPWDSLHIALPENSALFQQLKRSIEGATQTRIVPSPKEAQATLIVVSDSPGRSILSLTAAGRVREIQLSRSFTYRIVDSRGVELVPATPIVLMREMSFDDQLLFAKEAEEGMIQNEMQNDLVQQLLRRLSTARPTR